MSGSRVRAQVLFAAIPEWVLFAPELSAQAVRTYGVLYRVADRTSRQARVRHAIIAARAGQVHPSTIKRAIEELRSFGALEVIERVDKLGQHANDYYVLQVPRKAQQSLLPGDTEEAEPSQEASEAGGPRVSYPRTTGAPPSTGDPGPRTTGGPPDKRGSSESPVVRKTSPTAKSPIDKPTPDSIYLAERINERWQATKGRITVPALQRLVGRFGARAVEDSLRELHGFPPAQALRSAYAYLETICTERSLDPAEEASG